MRYALAASIAAMLLVPAQAGAYVQIHQGIAGARLGNSQAQVKSALGEPALVRNGSNDFGEFTTFYYEGGLRVGFQGKKSVTSVTTNGKGDRTTKGIGVGNTEKALRAKHKGLRCEGSGEFRACSAEAPGDPTRVTSFLISNGKIRRITVAFLLD